MLESLGLGEATAPDEADVVVFNTCTIREKPDTRLAAYLGNAGALKRERPDVVVAVGGCYAEAQRERIFELSTRSSTSLSARVRSRISASGSPPAATRSRAAGSARTSTSRPTSRLRAERRFQAWVQVSMGCNSACAYCIVPAVRGREQSRRPGDIVAEVTRLAASRRPRDHAPRSERELVGARPRPGDPHRVRRAPPRVRRRRRTSNGSGSRARTRRTSAIRSSPPMAECESVCEHVHLPAQSGSSRDPQGDAAYVRPRRGTSGSSTRLRERDPRPRARHGSHRRLPRGDRRTTSRRRCRSSSEVRFDSAFTFIYSPRAGTEAAAFRIQFPTTSSTTVSSGSSSGCSGSPPSGTPSASAASRRSSSRGRAGPIRRCCAGARGGTRRSTSPVCDSPGELVDVADRRRPRRRRCAAARRRSSRPERIDELHTLGTIRDPRVRIPRYARSGWWAGVPHGT